MVHSSKPWNKARMIPLCENGTNEHSKAAPVAKYELHRFQNRTKILRYFSCNIYGAATENERQNSLTFADTSLTFP